MSDDLWTNAGHDAEQDRLERTLTSARLAATHVWPFLADAESDQDYENRKALAADKIEAVATKQAGNDPILFGVIHTSLLDGFDEDYRIVAADRKEAARKSAAEGKTCSVCGDKIAQTDGEWHHDNGEKHDHKAKPGGKESRKTASDGLTRLIHSLVNQPDGETASITVRGQQYTVVLYQDQSRGDRGNLVPGSITGEFMAWRGDTTHGKELVRQHVSPTGQGSDTVWYSAEIVGEKILRDARRMNPPKSPFPDQGRSGSRRTAAEGKTCSSCGDKIAQTDGEWHHDNGEKHDHKAAPGGKESRRTASLTDDANAAYDRQDQAWFNALSTADLEDLWGRVSGINMVNMAGSWDDEVFEALHARGWFAQRGVDSANPFWAPLHAPLNADQKALMERQTPEFKAFYAGRKTAAWQSNGYNSGSSLETPYGDGEVYPVSDGELWAWEVFRDHGAMTSGETDTEAEAKAAVQKSIERGRPPGTEDMDEDDLRLHGLASRRKTAATERREANGGWYLYRLNSAGVGTDLMGAWDDTSGRTVVRNKFTGDMYEVIGKFPGDPDAAEAAIVAAFDSASGPYRSSRRTAGTYGDDNRCKDCGAHIAEPHDPDCPREGDGDDAEVKRGSRRRTAQKSARDVAVGDVIKSTPQHTGEDGPSGGGEVVKVTNSWGQVAIWFTDADVDGRASVILNHGDPVKLGSRRTASNGWIAEVAGTGEHTWSRNSAVHNTREEAEAAVRNLLGRWFGADMARVVTADTRPGERIDPSDPSIIVNHRTASRRTARGEFKVGDQAQMTEDDRDPDLGVDIPRGTTFKVINVVEDDESDVDWISGVINGEDFTADPAKARKVSSRKASWSCVACGSDNAHTRRGVSVTAARKANDVIKCGSCGERQGGSRTASSRGTSGDTDTTWSDEKYASMWATVKEAAGPLQGQFSNSLANAPRNETRAAAAAVRQAYNAGMSIASLSHASLLTGSVVHSLLNMSMLDSTRDGEQRVEASRQAANQYQQVENPYLNDPPTQPGVGDDSLDGPQDNPLTRTNPPSTTRPRVRPSGAPAEFSTTPAVSETTQGETATAEARRRAARRNRRR